MFATLFVAIHERGLRTQSPVRVLSRRAEASREELMTG